MTVGLLFAMTLPGVVVLLIVVAAVEHICCRRGRRSPLTGRRRHALSASGLDVFSAAVLPGKAVELAARAEQEQLRDDEGDGALLRGVVGSDGVLRLRYASRR